MATMFPSEVTSFTTPGEGLVYRFLQGAVRPDRDFLCWYEPDIDDRGPDFILYSPDCGLVVLEVKDWRVDQIVEADRKTVLLRIGNGQERRKHPLEQAKEYRNRLLGLLGKPPLGTTGQNPCPVGVCAVLPHISRHELREQGLQQVFPEDKLLCWDELQEQSPLVRDASGQSFRDWLKAHVPPRFAFSLSSATLNANRAAIFPHVRLDTPRRSQHGPNFTAQGETICAFDHDQEKLARSFGPGRMLLTGPSGSGKTLILAQQAWHLPRVCKGIKRILFVCFNLALVGYIRRLLAQKGASLGPDGVKDRKCHFYLICPTLPFLYIQAG